MDDAEWIRGIAEYIAARIAGAVAVYREIYRDDWRPAAVRNIGYLERRAGEICVPAETNPAAFVEQYRHVMWMTPTEIIMDVLRKAG